MALAEAVKTRENSYTVESAMDALLLKLDEALDDWNMGGFWMRLICGLKLIQFKEQVTYCRKNIKSDILTAAGMIFGE
ncbi:MAG: hypothetical protein K2P30_10750 [Lachnospiraceae bacterium]|nr:hypothetical protein [Lachnospiraceae bacterium]